jgi:hypothetical protein
VSYHWSILLAAGYLTIGSGVVALLFKRRDVAN